MPSMNRRTFLQSATIATTTLATLSFASAFAAEKPNWPIGCFNRPWTKWSYDDALDGIKSAGYKLTGLLTGQRGEAFTSSAATPEYLDNLKKRIAQRELAANMTVVRFKPDGALADNIADLRKQIENASRLELKFMLTFGVDKPEHYENFYRLMADAAAQTDQRGIRLVLKPQRGGSAASE